MDDLTIDGMISRRWQNAKSCRGLRESEYRHISDYIRPEHTPFTNGEYNSDSTPQITKIWDQTAIQANDQWARGVNSMTHNPATNWFSFKDKDTSKFQDRSVQAFYSEVNTDLHNEARESGLYLALLNRLQDVPSYGQGAIYSYDEGNEGHLTFEYVPHPECFFTLNRDGSCRSFFRPMQLTVYEAEQRGIDISECGESIKQAKDRRDETTRFMFLHHVCKSGELPGVRRNHEFTGYYFDTTLNKVVGEHGFHDMPYHVLSLYPVPQSPYGIGIGYKVLPEVRNLNGQRRQFYKIMDLESDSPMLAPSSAEGQEQRRPDAGEPIYGGMTGDGKRLWDPLYKGSQGTRIIAAENEASRNVILEAYHNHLMLMIATGQMTATEVASRDEKIIQAMGPFIIPMFSDLRSILMRMFHARMRAGVYGDLPEAFGPNETLNIEFEGILAKAHKKLIAGSITMFYTEALGTVGQIAPDELAGLDHGLALEHLGDARAIPSGIVPTAQERRQAREQANQQRQAAQAAEMAPKVAGAMKDAAAAVEMHGGQGGAGVELAA